MSSQLLKEFQSNRNNHNNKPSIPELETLPSSLSYHQEGV